MFSIAALLERAKEKSGIDSDYRLAKVLRINQSALSNYRSGRSLPNVEIVEALCALSGDDAGYVVANIEAERAKSPEAKNLWLRMAARMQGAATTAILSVCFAISLIAMSATDARATTVDAYKTGQVSILYIV